MASCRSCAEPILWVGTAGGKRMPLDADPVKPAGVLGKPEAGQLIVVDDVAIVQRAGASHVISNAIYTSHFSTCPDADAHRKPRR